MLVAVIFLLALLTIALAVALPKMSKQIQRDRELETMHRGKQYIRGDQAVLQEIRTPIRPMSMRWSSPPTTSASCAKNMPIRPPARRTGSRFRWAEQGSDGDGILWQAAGRDRRLRGQPDGRNSDFRHLVHRLLWLPVRHGSTTPGSAAGGSAGCANPGLTPSSGTPTSPTDPNADQCESTTPGSDHRLERPDLRRGGRSSAFRPTAPSSPS